jgi:molecular chaperone HtpG
LLKNTKNEHFTLEEYRAKVEGLQTDKNGQVVFIYSNDPAKQDSFIQAANRKDYDVLLLDSPIDNHFVNALEQKLDKTSLKRVDSSVASKLIEKDETLESVLTEEQSKAVKEVFEKAITKPGYTVEIVGLNPEELPVTVTMDEFMRRMKDMAAMGGGMGFYGSMPDSYKVAINGNHKLINRILQTEDAESQAKLAKQAVDLALLAQGMLTGAELTEFVSRSVELI